MAVQTKGLRAQRVSAIQNVWYVPHYTHTHTRTDNINNEVFSGLTNTHREFQPSAAQTPLALAHRQIVLAVVVVVAVP